jgi:hypothetical protein
VTTKKGRRAARRLAERRQRALCHQQTVGCQHPAPFCRLADELVPHEHQWRDGTEYVTAKE